MSDKSKRFVVIPDSDTFFIRDTEKDVFHGRNGLVTRYTLKTGANRAADRLNRAALQEKEDSMQFFIDEDMKNHGELRPMTLEILEKQGYEYRDGKLEQIAPVERQTASVNPAPEQSEPKAPAKPKRTYYITPRQQEQAERMAEKWDARAEAFYAGGEGWGQDTAGYYKTPEEADGAIDQAQKIRDAINSLLSGGGKWADVQIVRAAVSNRDELDAQIAATQDEKKHEAPEAHAPDAPEEKYDIGYGHMGNGLTFWNRLEEKNGDYVTVAHIDAERNVKILDPHLPESIKTWIADLSFSNDHTVSATQDTPVFTTPSEYDAKELDPIDQFAKDYYQCSLDTYRNGKPRDNPQTVARDIDGLASSIRDGMYHGIRENLARMAHNSKTPEQPLALMERIDQIERQEQIKNDGPSVIAPDPAIGPSERDLYGYTDPSMLPLLQYTAMMLYELDYAIYMLHPDNTEAAVFEPEEITKHDGIFGIDAEDWQASREFEEMKAAVKNSEATKEAMLIYGKNDSYGIYQIAGGREMQDYIMGANARLNGNGPTVHRGNYELIYTAPMTEGDTLDSIYAKFSASPQVGFHGHNLSISDVIVMKQGGDITSHYVDRTGFNDLTGFTGYEVNSVKKLAHDIDRLIHDNGQHGYHDGFVERESNVNLMAYAIESGDEYTEIIKGFLNHAVEENYSGAAGLQQRFNEFLPPTTVAEFEDNVRAGIPINLPEYIAAINKEESGPAPDAKKTPARKTGRETDKPSILAQLADAQKEAAQGKDQGKDAPKRNSEQEV